MADKQVSQEEQTLSSVFTTSFSNILAQLGISLVVSTYSLPSWGLIGFMLALLMGGWVWRRE